MLEATQPTGINQGGDTSQDVTWLKCMWNPELKDYNLDSDWYHGNGMSMWGADTIEKAKGRAALVLVQGTGQPVVGSD